MSKCEYCAVEFEPSAESQRFCGPTHRNKASRLRLKARRVEEGYVDTSCPRPEKIRYASYDDAERSLKNQMGRGLQAYECRCGGFHMGHVPSYYRDYEMRLASEHQAAV